MKTDLQLKLKKTSTRTELRYRYYEQKNSMINLGIAVPPTMQRMMSVLGWCSKAVDNLSDRLLLRDFVNDDFGIMDIYSLNNPDILFDSAISEALMTFSAIAKRPT